VAYHVAGAEALGADSMEEREVLWTFRSAQRTAEQWVAALENARRQAALDRPRRSLGKGLHERVVRPVHRLVESWPFKVTQALLILANFVTNIAEYQIVPGPGTQACPGPRPSPPADARTTPEPEPEPAPAPAPTPARAQPRGPRADRGEPPDRGLPVHGSRPHCLRRAAPRDA